MITSTVDSNLGWETSLSAYVPLPRMSASRAVWRGQMQKKQEMSSLNLNFNLHAWLKQDNVDKKGLS